MISIDSASIPSKALLNYLIKYSDLVLKINSFDGSDASPELKKLYNGTLQIMKQPALNGLRSFKAKFDLYAFKSERKSFKVEPIYFEPEDGDAPDPTKHKSKDTESPGLASTLCAPNPQTKQQFDF